MARKDYTPEQAIGMLREAEVRLSQGEKIGKICRGLGISEQSYYRWRRLYGRAEGRSGEAPEGP
jgi:putative transposase